MTIVLALFLSLLVSLQAPALDATGLEDAPTDGAQTTVVVRLLDGATLPPLDALRGWLIHDGRPLTVQAVDERTAQVIIVRDPGAQAVIDTVATRLGKATTGRRKVSQASTPDETLRASFAFARDIDFRLLTPTTAPPSHGRVATGNVFPYSEPISLHQGGLLWMLYHHRTTTFPLRFADSVAWAAGELATGGRRRAVVLLLGEGAVDGSQKTIDATRRQLDALQVPLLVWTTASVEPLYPEWTDVRSIHDPVIPKRNPELIAQALRELEETLERQRVLSVDGSPPLVEIELAPEARKVVELEGGS